MLKDKIILKSQELGFSLIGFAPYQTLDIETNHLTNWLHESYHAKMSYMERNIDKKKDVANILRDCKSIISLGMNYYVNEEYPKLNESGKVSRYAWGRDYHYTIWEKLEKLIGYIEILEPDIATKSYVDTGPVLDKVWAVKAGLGWQGKHSNIISKQIGSWFFIANIFTNYDFPSYNEQINDFCGTCTACIEACPTEAIIQDYIVDSNKCISYLTIENKNEIPDKFVGKFEDWIFGCDICQDVCPWNIKFSEPTLIKDFNLVKNKTIKFKEIENMSNKEFKVKYNDSPILRAKAKGIKRNAKVLINNLNLNKKL